MTPRKAAQAQLLLTITGMLEAYGQEATETRLHGYRLGLQGLAPETIEAAVTRALQQLKTVPTPAQLRELAGIATGPARAMSAWGDVEKAVYHGAYRHVDFEDKLINAVIRNMGGWVQFVGRFSSTDSESILRAQFLKCYEAFSLSGVDGHACAPLPGMAQASVRNGVVVAPIPERIRCSENRLLLPCVMRQPAAGPAIEAKGKAEVKKIAAGAIKSVPKE